MKKACLYVQKIYLNDEIFRPDSPLNRDNGLEFFHEMKKQFLKHGIYLTTQDGCSLEEAEFIIYNEVPQKISNVKYPHKSAVILFESELIRPDNWILENHMLFKHLFTWNDEFVDNKKYFKLNFRHSAPVSFKSFSEKRKFCTLIAGNKVVRHPLELYSKRVEAIRWFEKHHPDQFEFYGVGWEHYKFDFPLLSLISRVLNRIKPLTKLLAKRWPSYRGPVIDKLQTMKDFKFSICYENGRDICGYITEKIFDSMAAGCIPIYWGAPNISNFVPSECYINRTDFSTYEALYDYLSEMSESDYNFRQKAIEQYLESEKHKLFEADFNAKIVVDRLTNV